jgi:hypothetical protein
MDEHQPVMVHATFAFHILRSGYIEQYCGACRHPFNSADVVRILDKFMQPITKYGSAIEVERLRLGIMSFTRGVKHAELN